jgi:hypothetical protein
MTNTQKKPVSTPGEFLESGNSESCEESMPSLVPPSIGIGFEKGDGQKSTTVETVETAPSLPLGGGTTSGITAWQNSKKINALWSINQNRNAWIGVEGIGWKKLANNSDSAVVALTMLATHAFEKGLNVNYRDESDGMIHEIYVW